MLSCPMRFPCGFKSNGHNYWYDICYTVDIHLPFRQPYSFQKESGFSFSAIFRFNLSWSLLSNTFTTNTKWLQTVWFPPQREGRIDCILNQFPNIFSIHTVSAEPLRGSAKKKKKGFQFRNKDKDLECTCCLLGIIHGVEMITNYLL